MSTRTIFLRTLVAIAIVTAILLARRTSTVSPSADVGHHFVATETVRSSPTPHLNASVGNQVDIDGAVVDLSSVMERTHFAFERLGGEYVGGESTYGVRVGKKGFSVSPERPERFDVPDSSQRPPERGLALRIRTQRITRGSTSIADVENAEFVRRTDGTLAASRGMGITETLENTASGLEHAWRIGRPIGGVGNLEVEVATSGQAYVGTTATGIHFADGSTGLGISYGRATWVDAAGDRRTLATVFDGGTIRIVVPSDVLDGAAYPAVIDPTIGGEFGMDAPIEGPAVDVQRSPSIGHPGTTDAEFTVVWQDRRRSLDMTWDVYTTSVSRRGVPVNSTGTLASDPNESGDQISPRIVGDVVVYASNENAQNDNPNNYFRVKSRNLVTGHVTTLSAATTSDATEPAVASTQNTAVVWKEKARDGSNSSIHGIVIDSSGAIPSGGMRKDLSMLPGANVVSPAIAGNGLFGDAGFLLVFSDNSLDPGRYNISGYGLRSDLTPNTLLQRYTNAVTPTTANPQPTFHSSHPALACFGNFNAPYNGYLVVWERASSQQVNAPGYNIYGRYAGANGTVSGAELAISTASGNQRYPGVTNRGSDGAQAFVTWSDTRTPLTTHVRGARVNLSMSSVLTLFDGPSGTGGINMGGTVDASYGVATQTDDISGYFIVWGDFRNGSIGDIYGSNVPWNAALNATSPNYAIASSANKQSSPAVQRCGGIYLAVWADTRNEATTGSDLYGSIIDADGTVLVPGFAISTAAGSQDVPVIGCNLSDLTFFGCGSHPEQRRGDPERGVERRVA